MVAGKAMRKAMGLQKSPGGGKEVTPPKPPLPPPSSSGSKSGLQKSPFSRSFGVYFPRSSAQVQPRPPDVAELLRLVEELRDRESRLKTEILEHKLLRESVSILPALENEIAAKDGELERASAEIESLKYKNERLIAEIERVEAEKKECEKILQETEAKFSALAEENGRKLREIEETMSEMRMAHERKVVELESEVSELKKTPSCSSERGGATAESDELFSSQRFVGLVEVSVKSNLIQSLKKTNSKSFDFCSNLENHRNEAEIERPSHSRCNSDELAESTISNIRSRAPRVPKPPPRPSSSSKPASSSDSSDSEDGQDFAEKSVPPPPRPPPLPVSAKMLLPPPPPPPPTIAKPAPPPLPPPSKSTAPPPPPAKSTAPPPPPPPPNATRLSAAKVRRVPEVVEFYHSLMRRDSRRESGGGITPEVLPASSNARDMIGEIENRSAYLHAIKTDVETQGDFIRFLIKEVENAAFTNIEDVVPFVKWLDDELSYLVDERAVLKHFEWPEQKADALREAAFGYCDLRKLETEASSYCDIDRQPCGSALKKMQSLLEKLEHSVYNLSRMRESAANRYRGFNIPTDWMLDTGIMSQIKLASVKLARKYMKRVSAELESVGGGPEEEELIVQGVRFAFRVHQFAGGFDVETMTAFEELRDKARSCHAEQQHKVVSCSSRSSTAC